MVLRILSQSLFELVVPDRDCAVRSSRGERIVSVWCVLMSGRSYIRNSTMCSHRMKRECVNRPYMVHVVDGHTVALERVLLVLCLRAWIEVLDSNPAFNRGSRITYTANLSDIRYRTHKHTHTLSVSHARQRPRHKFQAALTCLRGRVHLAYVVDVEKSTGHRDNECVVHEVHVVHAFGKAMRGLLWRGRARVPEADSAVPGAGDERICKGSSLAKRRGSRQKDVLTGAARPVHAGDRVGVLAKMVHFLGLEVQSELQLWSDVEIPIRLMRRDALSDRSVKAAAIGMRVVGEAACEDSCSVVVF